MGLAGIIPKLFPFPLIISPPYISLSTIVRLTNINEERQTYINMKMRHRAQKAFFLEDSKCFQRKNLILSA